MDVGRKASCGTSSNTSSLNSRASITLKTLTPDPTKNQTSYLTVPSIIFASLPSSPIPSPRIGSRFFNMSMEEDEEESLGVLPWLREVRRASFANWGLEESMELRSRKSSQESESSMTERAAWNLARQSSRMVSSRKQSSLSSTVSITSASQIEVGWLHIEISLSTPPPRTPLTCSSLPKRICRGLSEQEKLRY